MMKKKMMKMMMKKMKMMKMKTSPFDDQRRRSEGEEMRDVLIFFRHLSFFRVHLCFVSRSVSPKPSPPPCSKGAMEQNLRASSHRKDSESDKIEVPFSDTEMEEQEQERSSTTVVSLPTPPTTATKLVPPKDHV